MMPLPKNEISRKLRLLKFAMAEADAPLAQTPDPSLPGLALFKNPEKVGRFPSGNPNRIECDPHQDAVDDSSIAQAIRQFTDAGISKFFFWFDPVSVTEDFGKRLECLGFRRFDGTQYPVLLRRAEKVPPHKTEFEIREITKENARADCACYGDDAARKKYHATIGHPAFRHFAAFCEGTPVASARLFLHEGWAYLCDAGTLEEYRNRGAQNALITARVRRAAQDGCTACAVETLRFLEDSLRNLERNGFQEQYERTVYEFSEA